MLENKKREMLVSVVIPTCRRPAALLGRAVLSVCRQTHRNLEIIIVDDSPADDPLRDQTAAYIRSLQDGRIRYLQNESNCGGALARNRGIFASHGEYITFLDDDDEYLPRKVERQVQFMEDTRCDVSLSEMIMYSEAGRVVDYRDYRDLKDFSRQGLMRYHLMKHLTGTPTYMFRAEKLKAIGGFDDAKVGQEFYLMAKAIQRGLTVGYLPVCDVKIHRHACGGISFGRNKIEGEKALYQYKKTFYGQLTAADRRYIRFRHYAVMAVAYRRNGMYLRMLWAGLIAIVSAPVVFMKEISKFVGKILKHSKRKKVVLYEQKSI